MFSLQRLQDPAFWLTAITAAIATIHLTLLYRADDSELLSTSVLFWGAAGYLLWDRRKTLILESTLAPTLFGLLLLGLVLLRSAGLPISGGFLKGFPVLAILGLGLLASGFRGLRQYWRELLIFGLLAIYPFLSSFLQVLNLPQLTAKAGTFLLLYAGFEVKRQGLFLVMPTGRVEVYGACSGVHSILQMLSVAVLFLLLFPLRSRWQKLLCVGVALFIGFFVNAGRVALMAVLVGWGQTSSFEYWHGGDGSLIFSVISIAIFGAFCWFVFLRSPQSLSESSDRGLSAHD